MQQLLGKYLSNVLMLFSCMTFKEERFWTSRLWMEWKESTGLRINNLLLYAQTHKSFFAINTLKLLQIWKRQLNLKQVHLMITMPLFTLLLVTSSTFTRVLTRMESLFQWKTQFIFLTSRMVTSSFWTGKVRWKSSRWIHLNMNSKLHLRIRNKVR